MPRYGANMEEGMVASWLVSEGDEVKQGDVICEIEIEKLTNEMESPAEGVVRKIVCPEGEIRACGELIAVIAGAEENISALLSGEEAPSSAAEPAAAESISTAPAAGPPVATTSVLTTHANSGDVKITPKALKLAEEEGIDYSGIRGNGIHGAITRKDIRDYIASGGVARPKTVEGPVRAAAEGVSQQSGGLGGAKMSTVRKVTARRMMESIHSTAQLSICMDADVTNLVRFYEREKPRFKEQGVKLSYTALILKALAGALELHPKIRTIVDAADSLKTLETIDIGIAIDAEYGLIVPVLREVDKKDLKAICKELARIVDRTQAGSLTPDEMSGGCITVSNVGMMGVKYFTPILNTPESAILGIGTLEEEPRIIDGGFHARWILHLSLTYDHRVIDGAPAARFMQDFTGLLGKGE